LASWRENALHAKARSRKDRKVEFARYFFSSLSAFPRLEMAQVDAQLVHIAACDLRVASQAFD
jgi:hypothetical protein